MNPAGKILMWVVVPAFQVACSYPADQLSLSRPEPLTLAELTSVLTVETLRSRDKRANDASIAIKKCLKAYRRVGKAMKILEAAQSDRAHYRETLPRRISRFTPHHCTGPAREKTARDLRDYLNENRQVVGIILPISGRKHEYAESILKGIKTAYAEEKGKEKGIVLAVRDSAGSPQGARNALAGLILDEGASVIVGGLLPEEASAMIPFASRLVTPFLILNQDKALIESSNYAFQVYPNVADQVRSLLEVARLRRFKKVAVLRPDTGIADHVTGAFRSMAGNWDIRVSGEYSYKPGDYESMNRAVMGITHTDPKQRAEEYQKLILEARQQAEKEQVPFNPRGVVLAPELEADAVFLPDNFKMVRFFIKLFRYHGIKKLPLIGTQVWRSSELVFPWDGFIEGSFFSDFIGRYSHVISRFSPGFRGSDLFVEPRMAVHVDLQIIGYRSMMIAAGLTRNQFVKRRFMVKTLHKQHEYSKLFNLRSFYADRSSRWPAYVFGVEEKTVSLLDPGSEGKGARARAGKM